MIQKKKNPVADLFKNPLTQIIIFAIVAAIVQLLGANGIISASFVQAVGTTLIYAIVSVGFCLLLGYSGLASLGTGGFIGLGAYVAFYVIQEFGLPYIVALIAAILVSIIIGVVVGFISLRIEGIYLAILTLGLSEIIRNLLMVIKATVKIDVDHVALFGTKIGDTGAYYLILATFGVLMWLLFNLIRSPTGRAMVAMKNSTSADLVILEVNPKMPFTLGDVQVHVDEVDYMIKVDYEPPVTPDMPFTEKDATIGKLIADMVPDGACIQLGIGGIPNAVAEMLKTKNDLGVHTEMLTSNMMRLAKMGVINGRCKNINRGKMVTTFAMGVPELYEFMDYNPGVAVMDGAWTNDPYVIAQNDNQISINTSLEVDLTGQCASESIGSKQYSGTGGQADTAIGAQMSKNGKSIIALYSTAMVKGPDGEKHEVSKIVPQLTPGAAVSLHRSDVDRVVTEYGVAELRGTNIRERVARLIEIAHPKFREELWEQAVKVGILGCRR